jgi:hypothetical protein
VALSGDVSVRPAGASTVEVSPGTRLTIGFLVGNASPSERPIWTSLTLPASWRVVIGDAPFVLAPGASEARLITLAIPSTTPEGVYSVRYTAAPADNPLDSAATIVEVRVPSVRQLQIHVAEHPSDVLAGSPFQLRYKVSNIGNAVELVYLKTFSLQPTPELQLDPTVLQLAPQETRDVVVNVVSLPEANQAYHTRIDLLAQLQSDTTVVRRISATVRVIPSPTMVAARYHNIPFMARLRYGGEGNRSGPQFELMGTGSVRADGNDQFDFLVRTPDLQQTTLLGYRDEYRLSYRSEDLQLYVGDHGYVLSPLTEYGRYAFGAGGSFRTGDLSFTAFANRDRFQRSNPAEVAASASIDLSANAQVSANYLRRQNNGTSNIVTARGQFRDVWKTQGDIELGHDFGNGQNNAIAAHWWGRDHWGGFMIQYVHAGPQYEAYYSDVDFKSAAISLTQLWPIRVDANFRDDRRNLDLDTNQYSAPRSTHYDASIGYMNTLMLEYRYNRYYDALPGSTFARAYSSVLLQANYNTSVFGLLGQFEFGRENEEVTGSFSNFRRYALLSSLTPSLYQSYGFSLEYYRNADLLTGEPINRIAGSLRAGVSLPGGTTMLAHFFSGRSLIDEKASFSYLDLSFSQRLPFGHTISARARHSVTTPSAESEELAYLFEYAIPFAIPLRIAPTVGVVRGSLRDEETGKPLVGAIVTLDQFAVIVDEDGAFLFPEVRPGSHQLDLGPGTIPTGHVSLPQLPVVVSLADGEPREIDVVVVRGATVTGRVSTISGPDHETVRGTPEAEMPVPNLIVEMTCGARLQRRRSGPDGRYEFSGLPPGQWQLRVLDESMPPGLRITIDTATFTLRPGDRQEIRIRAIPLQRQIRMLEEGKVILDTSAHTAITPPQRPDPPTPPGVTRSLPRAPSAIVLRSGKPARYTIQISSWKSKERSTKEASLYSGALGAKVTAVPFTSKTGATGYRVIAGPYSSKAQADSLARRLRGK